MDTSARKIGEEEQRIFDGKLFAPGHPDLRAIKLRSHKLSLAYSQLPEDETAQRNALLVQILGGPVPEGCFIQGPVFFHYGVHTRIGKRFFGNYNLTIQDDALVTIGDDNNYGPNVTIVTPVHPLLPDERKLLLNQQGQPARLCYAKPVRIGNNVWLSANVTVCSGVTIGDNCVIGAGSVVTRDIPANSFAAGVPCRVIRTLSEQDSMRNHPEILQDCAVPEKE
ncbi:MAG: sugar O-acetyltransferase [Eubacteriales bacterium]|mgnify:FL=1|nr:sugar O-acetyltransferase [Eubacteriales bacterium]